jgi:hypothetical protein
MEKHFIEYDGKEYRVNEPTIELWTKLNTLKDLYEEKDFSIIIISLATGLSTDQLRDASWEGVYETSTYLSNYLLKDGDKFQNEFEFKGKKYRFISLENLTFGEFIDIDEFLSRDPSKKASELNLLMALLYREVDEDGKLTPYDASLLRERAELFRQLPVKYLNGAMVFFCRLENILRVSTHSFLRRQMMNLKWKVIKALRTTGGGIHRWYTYRGITFSKYTRWLVDLSLRFSTFLRIKKTSTNSGNVN